MTPPVRPAMGGRRRRLTGEIVAGTVAGRRRRFRRVSSGRQVSLFMTSVQHEAGPPAPRVAIMLAVLAAVMLLFPRRPPAR